MAYPTPASPTLIAEPSSLPTIVLEPPPGLQPSRSLHVPPLALVPLIASLLVMGLTTTYVWKLWQRDDKYYIEEDYTDEELVDFEMTTATPRANESDAGMGGGRPGTPESLIAVRMANEPDAPMGGGRPGTPESLIAVRKAAQAAVVRAGISRPFAARTIPLSPQSQESTGTYIQRQGQSTEWEATRRTDPAAFSPVHMAWTMAVPPAEHSEGSDAAATIHDPAMGSDGMSIGSQDSVQRGKEVDTFTEAGYDDHRISGLDWKDDEGSVQGSDFSKYRTSKFERSSYSNRYGDY